MKRRVLPVLLMLAGFSMVFEPLKAIGSCGLNPEIMQPSSCQAPKTAPPNPSGGYCEELPDGSCISVGCSMLVWENAVPGLCGNGVITEDGIPRCESDFGATAMTIHQFAWSCEYKKSCKCVLKATGASTNVTVCNCRDWNRSIEWSRTADPHLPYE